MQRKQEVEIIDPNPNNSYKTKKNFTGSYTEVNSCSPAETWNLNQPCGNTEGDVAFPKKVRKISEVWEMKPAARNKWARFLGQLCKALSTFKVNIMEMPARVCPFV